MEQEASDHLETPAGLSVPGQALQQAPPGGRDEVLSSAANGLGPGNSPRMMRGGTTRPLGGDRKGTVVEIARNGQNKRVHLSLEVY